MPPEHFESAAPAGPTTTGPPSAVAAAMPSTPLITRAGAPLGGRLVLGLANGGRHPVPGGARRGGGGAAHALLELVELRLEGADLRLHRSDPRVIRGLGPPAKGCGGAQGQEARPGSTKNRHP